MTLAQRLKIFQKVATSILILFFSIMAFVTYAAYLRPSGSTGVDAAKIQKIRYETQQRLAGSLK